MTKEKNPPSQGRGELPSAGSSQASGASFLDNFFAIDEGEADDLLGNLFPDELDLGDELFPSLTSSEPAKEPTSIAPDAPAPAAPSLAGDVQTPQARDTTLSAAEPGAEETREPNEAQGIEQQGPPSDDVDFVETLREEEAPAGFSALRAENRPEAPEMTLATSSFAADDEETVRENALSRKDLGIPLPDTNAADAQEDDEDEPLPLDEPAFALPEEEKTLRDEAEFASVEELVSVPAAEAFGGQAAPKSGKTTTAAFFIPSLTPPPPSNAAADLEVPSVAPPPPPAFELEEEETVMESASARTPAPAPRKAMKQTLAFGVELPDLAALGKKVSSLEDTDPETEPLDDAFLEPALETTRDGALAEAAKAVREADEQEPEKPAPLEESEKKRGPKSGKQTLFFGISMPSEQELAEARALEEEQVPDEDDEAQAPETPAEQDKTSSAALEVGAAALPPSAMTSFDDAHDAAGGRGIIKTQTVLSTGHVRKGTGHTMENAMALPSVGVVRKTPTPEPPEEDDEAWRHTLEGDTFSISEFISSSQAGQEEGDEEDLLMEVPSFLSPPTAKEKRPSDPTKTLLESDATKGSSAPVHKESGSRPKKKSMDAASTVLDGPKLPLSLDALAEEDPFGLATLRDEDPKKPKTGAASALAETELAPEGAIPKHSPQPPRYTGESASFDKNSTLSRTTILPRFALTDNGPAWVTDDKLRYQTVRKLGEGGVAEVELVQDHDIERLVALKRLKPELQGAAAPLYRFVEEIQTIGRLEHPNIIPIHDVGVDEEGQFFFVMKYVEGQTLEEIIEKLNAGDPETDQRYTFAYRTQVFLEILRAVQFAHAQGIIHRDLKPANIMVGPYGEVMVMDWGIAKQIRETPDDLSEAYLSHWERQNPGEGNPPASPKKRLYETHNDTLIGSPAYMSPEQALGKNDELDERSDIYSLSLLFYEFLTLQHPLAHKEKLEELLFAIVKDQAPFAANAKHKHQSAVPAELSHFVHRGLQKRPKERFASIQEMVDELQLYLEGRGKVQCPITAGKRAGNAFVHFMNDHWFLAFCFLLTTLVLLVGGVIQVSSWLQALLS